MAVRINRWNLYQQPIASQMEYHRSRRAEAREQIDKATQLANSFASITSNKVREEGNLVSQMAMQRMGGQRVSKQA